MIEIPQLGLGTWQNTDPEKCAEAVKLALEMGYEHIDTAQIYRNEEDVGRGIQQAEIDRKDFFLASKVWIDKLEPEKVKESTKKSVEKLGVDYIDLMYVHWPSGSYQPQETLKAFKEMVHSGEIKKIGISNFQPQQVEKAMEIAPKHIIANQVEMHPLLQQEKLLEKCSEHDIKLVAYSPLARGEVFNVAELSEIAEKHDVSEAQVSLAWLMQKEDVVPIPKATGKEHIHDNFNSLNLELDEEDIEKIKSIEREERTVDPSFAPW
jgi:Aldo/keto reductases, related to diketogulonate reductase